MNPRRLLAVVLLLIPLAIAVGAAGVEVAGRAADREVPDVTGLAMALRDMDRALVVWSNTLAPRDRQQFVDAEGQVEAALLKLTDRYPTADLTDLKLELSTDLMPLLIRGTPDQSVLQEVSAAVHELALAVEEAAASRRLFHTGLAAARLRQRLIEIEGLRLTQ